MITLYNFGPFQGLPDASPFCLKVDCYLRATGLDFKTKSGANYVGKSPKKKLPYIEDGGKTIGDSTFIIDYLKEKYGDKLDGDLNVEQQAIAHAFKKMLDENLYWCLVHSRWIENWPVTREVFFGAMPAPLKLIIPGIVHSGVKKSLHYHGMGRHSDVEIHQIGRRDITALDNFLGNKDYFLLNRPTTLDIWVYAILAEMIVPDLKCELNDTAKSFDKLVKFVERMHKQFYDK